jgi:hypothetical protein
MTICIALDTEGVEHYSRQNTSHHVIMNSQILLRIFTKSSHSGAFETESVFAGAFIWEEFMLPSHP